ncbi:hypothetical protein SAMN05421544_10318 [Riemerella columbipharyngis]|uniref:Uncharacterized protein n=1 Tax=Riemerella columbipharyngis TaxID=1071918 RepID=A0A1G7A2Y1_9FLAO|nr:hypothetical protein SAMN05421544_10318 [Riemerella columbipharyngis]
MRISYKEDIITWLEKCVAISSRFPLVRETLVQYINHLKILTYQDINTKNEKEIIEYLSENIEPAKNIHQNYDKVYDYLTEKYFNPNMEKFAKEKGLKYVFNGSKEYCIDFYLIKDDWDNNYWIKFHYDRDRDRKYHYGLCKHENYSITDEKRQKLLDFISGTNKPSSDDWYPFYFNLDYLSVERWQEEIINNSDKFFKDCTERIEEILLALKKAGMD